MSLHNLPTAEQHQIASAEPIFGTEPPLGLQNRGNVARQLLARLQQAPRLGEPTRWAPNGAALVLDTTEATDRSAVVNAVRSQGMGALIYALPDGVIRTVVPLSRGCTDDELDGVGAALVARLAASGVEVRQNRSDELPLPVKPGAEDGAGTVPITAAVADVDAILGAQ